MPPTTRQSSRRPNCACGTCCGTCCQRSSAASRRRSVVLQSPASCGRSCRSDCAAAAPAGRRCRPAPCTPAGARGTRPASASGVERRRRLRRCATTTIACPSVGCANAERGDFADEPRRVEDFLDFGRTDAVAGGLDHLVAPADEVQEAVVVHAHGVAREDGDLGQHRGPLRRGPAAACSARRSSPGRSSSPCRPARRDARARRARRRRTACRRRAARGSRRSGSPCRSNRAGDRLPPAAGTSSGTPRSARTSGTAACCGSRRRSAASVSRGMRAAGVREVAQVLGDRLPATPAAASWMYSGGTAVSPVTRSLHQRVEHVLRQQIVEQHDARAGVERRRQLAEAGVEGQRQRGEQRVVGGRSRDSRRRSSRRRPCCDGTAPRPSACRCCRTCRGSPPCRCRSRDGLPRRRPRRSRPSRHDACRHGAAAAPSSPITTTWRRSGHRRGSTRASAGARADVTSTRTLQSRRM